MAEIYDICNTYGITPEHVTANSSNVYKIQDQGYFFALKKSSLTNATLKNWVNVLHEAHYYHLTCIPPVFLTKQNQLYVRKNSDIYYLTPWINETEQVTLGQMFSCLGEIHQKTKKKYNVENEDIPRQFAAYRSACSQLQRRLIHYIEQFESVHFMSPIELQVCTHFHKVEQAIKLTLEHVERFLQEISTTKEWSISLCHRNITRSHFITNNMTYLINWEQSYYDQPMVDLLALFCDEIQNNGASAEQLKLAYDEYTTYNKLSLSELYYLLIHLLNPVDYIELIKEYSNKTMDRTMLEHVQLLEKSFRKINFGIEWNNILELDFQLNPF
ncbi:hypothetical protein ACLIBH_09450 [Virgibacillus sp. W0430]|uniref:hypothetical protein n=1 Tax=Virgibacillus sp. W0430 TaxID=3391580 RepID=UPI003F45C3E0